MIRASYVELRQIADEILNAGDTVNAIAILQLLLLDATSLRNLRKFMSAERWEQIVEPWLSEVSMNEKKAFAAYEKAIALRDQCMEEMSKCAQDPVTYVDPGDAVVTIDGNDRNVLAVLYILNAIGIPGCRAR